MLGKDEKMGKIRERLAEKACQAASVLALVKGKVLRFTSSGRAVIMVNACVRGGRCRLRRCESCLVDKELEI